MKAKKTEPAAQAIQIKPSTAVVVLDNPDLELVGESRAKQIKKTFEPMIIMLDGFESSYNELINDSETEITAEITKRAKRMRIDIGKVRIETDKIAAVQKNDILIAGRAIDGVRNILKWAVSEKELKLKEIEDFFAIQESKRLEKLQDERVKLLDPFVDGAAERALSKMDEDVWNAYLSVKKKDFEDRAEAEKIAEEQRILEAAAKAKKIEEQKIENARLKAEAEKAEADLAKERKKAAEAQLKIIQEAAAENKKLKAEKDAADAKIMSLEASRTAEMAKATAATDEKRLEKGAEIIDKIMPPDQTDEEQFISFKKDLQDLKSKYSFADSKTQKKYINAGLLIDKIIVWLK